MKSRLCLFMLLVLLSATVLASAQGEKKPRTIDDYRPRTLLELSTLLPEAIRASYDEHAARANKDDLSIIVHGELLPSRLKVQYAGMTRPIHQDRKNVIRTWANQFAGAPEFYIKPYQTEALFTEGTESYWLAIRSEAPSQEWKNGEALDLCVIKFGSIRIDGKLEPVILVERVIKP